jgi:ElaB/YqjD/DUF883 family membrane-anchored ribosome-binding protein
MTVVPGGTEGTEGTEGTALSKAAQGNSHGASKRAVDVEALRREIAHTRAELGETMQALAAKADVKARLQETADEARARVRERLQSVVPKQAQDLAVRTGRAVRRNPVPVAAAAGAAVLVVLFIRWRRNR